MRTTLDCVPCFIRQALEVARLFSPDPAVHEQIVRDTLRAAYEMDLGQSPPLMGRTIHRRLRELTGQDDPYKTLKDRFNRTALGALRELEARVHGAASPLEMAVRLAIAGNMIDLGVDGTIEDEAILEALDRVLEEPFVGDVVGFRSALTRARRILYLTDNAGEIVLDRLLIAHLPADRVTVVVRGSPVINDATMDDARAAGLLDLVEVIDNGSDVPGTHLADCSAEFRRRFAEADLIIAKGQGNYETLGELGAGVYFLLKVKCPVIAAHLELELGTHALLRR